jgi:adenosine deaminase
MQIVFLFSTFLAALAWAKIINTEEDELIVKQMPKIELHAHLHGSVRLSTLQELAALNGEENNVILESHHAGMVEKPFELFPLIHKTINRKEIVQQVLLEMIQDFANENTIYLEIRSTPRTLADGTTPHEYLLALVEMIDFLKNMSNGISPNTTTIGKMMVRLIVSIDRAKPYQEAFNSLQSIKEIQEQYPGIIVGIDFSGNPLGGRFNEFIEIFKIAREKLGLKVTIHAAETKELSDPQDDETEYILNFKYVMFVIILLVLLCNNNIDIIS